MSNEQSAVPERRSAYPRATPRGRSGRARPPGTPEDIARRLMELSFLPGHIIVPARSAPGGEPRLSRRRLRSGPAKRNCIATDPAAIQREQPKNERLPQLRRMCGCRGSEGRPITAQRPAHARRRHHRTAQLRGNRRFIPHRAAPESCQLPRRHGGTTRRQSQDAQRNDATAAT